MTQLIKYLLDTRVPGSDRSPAPTKKPAQQFIYESSAGEEEPGLHSDFQDSRGYIESLFQKVNKIKNKTKQKLQTKPPQKTLLLIRIMILFIFSGQCLTI